MNQVQLIQLSPDRKPKPHPRDEAWEHLTQSVGTYCWQGEHLLGLLKGPYICRLEFSHGKPSQEDVLLWAQTHQMRSQPVFNQDSIESLLSHFFTQKKIEMALSGTDFQNAVWKKLLEIPQGTTQTYQEIANKIGRPKAVRAVANAIAANPISLIIPCHRVVHSNGGLGGYRWGLAKKKQILEAEGVKLD